MTENDNVRGELRRLIVDNGDNHTNEELFNNVLYLLSINPPIIKRRKKCCSFEYCCSSDLWCCFLKFGCKHFCTLWWFKLCCVFWTVLIGVSMIHFKKW